MDSELSPWFPGSCRGSQVARQTSAPDLPKAGFPGSGAGLEDGAQLTQVNTHRAGSGAEMTRHLYLSSSMGRASRTLCSVLSQHRFPRVGLQRGEQASPRWDAAGTPTPADPISHFHKFQFDKHFSCACQSPSGSPRLREDRKLMSITEDSGRQRTFKTCGLTEPWRTDRPSAGKRGEAQPTAAEQGQDFGLPKGVRACVSMARGQCSAKGLRV